MENAFTKYESSKDFTTLDAWRKARCVRLFFYNEVVPINPSEEKFGLAVQIRRASVSATANISEGYGRFYFKEGVRHYWIARGSLYELKDHLITCLDQKYISDVLANKGFDLIEDAKITLNGFIKFVQGRSKGL